MNPALQARERWLEPRLNAIRARFPSLATEQQRAVLERSVDRLRASGCNEQALKLGQTAPDFALVNQRGDVVRLGERLRQGPLVLIFFRGRWCPYCRVTLMAWSRQLAELRAAGVGLLAVSPQSREACAETARRLKLDYDLLSDLGSEIAASFGLAFCVGEEYLALHSQLGVHLGEYNGGDDRHLPIPATYLLDAQARVRLVHVDGDFRERLEPADCSRALRAFTPSRWLS